MIILTAAAASLRWRALGAGALLLAFAVPAMALDVVASSPPQAISDSKLTIGSRSVALPAGEWTLIAKTETAITRGGVKSGAIHNTYAALLSDKALRAGVVLQMPASSVPMSSWNNQPCKVDNSLFKNWAAPSTCPSAC